jgi:RNA polymerase subunit RPABC4/transcription elongation factor Spt4
MQEVINSITSNPLFNLSRNLCILFYLVFWFALVFWTWRDASRRGAMAWFWAIVVLFFSVFGWAIYMVIRPPEYEEDAKERELEIRAKEADLALNGQQCPACLKAVEDDYLICPYCMKKLKKSCVSCDRALKLNWQVCPYCKTKQ